MKNIAIQTTDGELTLLYTDGDIERAKQMAKAANLEVEDIFEIPDHELEFYCFDGRVWDNGKELEVSNG